MPSVKNMLAAAAGAGGDVTNVENVFNTHLYTGTGSAQTITNGIDLSGEGGLVWIKNRENQFQDHSLFDTTRSPSYVLYSNTTHASSLSASRFSSFNTNGFTVGTDTSTNESGKDIVSWTFRKAPKFFDIVTFSGNSTNRTISHNLGTAPGFMVVKRTSGSGTNWMCFHRSVGATKGAILNGSNAFSADSTTWNNTAPTASVFSLGTDGNVNKTGHDYVAYLWAHNNSDGEFGPNSDQDIIKCGSYTGNNSADGPTIDLGFEPQWVMVKHTTNGFIDWYIFDNMRAFTAKGINGNKYLRPNSSGAEDGSQDYITPRPDGFQVHGTGSHTNANAEYVYIAIRRGPMATPTSASDVFAMDDRSGGPPNAVSGFPVDMGLFTNKASNDNKYIGSRLTQGKRLYTNQNYLEGNSSELAFDYQNGFINRSDTSTDNIHWMWKRAPGYFDVVTYVGNGVQGHNITHNLGVAPDMMWVKQRNTSFINGDWQVYVSGITHLSVNGSDPDSYGNNPPTLKLNSTDAANFSMSGTWDHTHPTSSVFRVGDTYSTNRSGDTYIAYLFATLSGISKVGTYTGTGSNGNNVDCGFSSGARFVLIRRAKGDEWMVFDTFRGITSANNDPKIPLDSTGAENQNSARDLNPLSSGFTVNGSDTGMNKSGDVYIFYAIA